MAAMIRRPNKSASDPEWKAREKESADMEWKIQRDFDRKQEEIAAAARNEFGPESRKRNRELWATIPYAKKAIYTDEEKAYYWWLRYGVNVRDRPSIPDNKQIAGGLNPFSKEAVAAREKEKYDRKMKDIRQENAMAQLNQALKEGAELTEEDKGVFRRMGAKVGPDGKVVKEKVFGDKVFGGRRSKTRSKALKRTRSKSRPRSRSRRQTRRRK